MDLFENDLLEEKKKVKKIGTALLISIIIVILLILGVVMAIVYYKSMQLGIFINGVASPISNTTVITEDSGKMYISIRELSKRLGYSYYNGTYGTASEDNRKGFVQNETDEEVAAFEMNSKKIYKTLLNNNAKNNEYDYLYIDEPIKFINGNLYTTIEGIQKIFNSDINYNPKNNKIIIRTLDNLEQYYTSIVANYGYNQLDERFYNTKAIISKMLIVRNNSGKYGVIDLNGNVIIGAKYDDITYIETTNEFLVENNKKVGIVNNLGKTKISLEYEELKLLDNDSGLYLAKLNNKYGVLNKQGAIIVYIEYDSIGIDKTLYKESDITNPYLLYNNCIPVEKNKKWGIINTAGKTILPTDYDSIGCVVSTSQNRTANNAILLPDYEGIIIGKNVREDSQNRKTYAVINPIGDTIVGFGGIDSIYYITENGKDIYQIESNGRKGNLDEVFKQNGIEKVNKDIIDPESGGGDISINENIISNNITTNSGNNRTQTTEDEENQPNDYEQQNGGEE